MEDNRTRLLILLGVLVSLCFFSLLCVGLGGLAYMRSAAVDRLTPPDVSTLGTPGTRPAPQPKGDNELTIPGGEPPSLDPALARDATSATYLVEIFSGLVRLSPQMEVEPDIATGWETSSDGLTYTFALRDDAKFADGSAITAEDFKYTFERACDPATQSPVADTYLGDIVGCRDKLNGSASEVSGVQVVDATHLAITIDAPKVYFLSKLTYPTAYVVDQAAVEAGGRLWATENPNGSGPFKLDNYTFGESLVMVPNPNYYGDPKPSVERVTFLLSGGSGMTMYETDEIDIVGVGLADLDRVQDPSSPLNADLREVETLNIGYVALNINTPPFDDPLVRQAFNMAMDKERIADVVLEDTVTPAYGILPPGIPGADANFQGLRFDAARAQQLLTESKYGGAANLPPITLHVPSGGGGSVGPDTEAMIEMWKQNLGVDVAIEQTEWATFLSDINQRPNPYQMFSLGWVADYPDPENFLDVHFHCNSQSNQTGYCNPEVDRLLEQARTEQNQETRISLYQQVEKLVTDEGAWIPLWFPKGYSLVKPWVNDYTFAPGIVPTLQYVTITQK